MKVRLIETALLSFFLLSSADALRAQIPATALCGTGLTPRSLSPLGCLTSTPISPINSFTGGPIVDYNWTLPTHYPTALSTEPPPNPCAIIRNYSPTPVNYPDQFWVSNDAHSQWIGPNGGDEVPFGWYIYRTSFRVPRAVEGYPYYAFEITGQFAADNAIASIYLEDLDSDSVSCTQLASYNYLNPNEYAAWNPFHVSSPVLPATFGYIYFVVYNAPGNPAAYNPSGLRVEFTRADFIPY